jgi:hypothetical protein
MGRVASVRMAVERKAAIIDFALKPDCQDRPTLLPFQMALARSMEREVLGRTILPLDDDRKAQAALAA